MFIIKFQNGASGVQRLTFGGAIDAAVDRRPARVYRVGAPNVLLAIVHVDGGIDFTQDGAMERRTADREFGTRTVDIPRDS
jgi:hypothetical protein